MSKFSEIKPNVKKKIKILTLFLLPLLLFSGISHNAFAAISPSQQDISNRLTYWAQQYNIPPVVLKATAWAESDWRQFNLDGSPLMGFDGKGIGIMQISDYNLNLGITTDRLDGADRYGTAVAVARKFGTATTAILAPSAESNLVDALAAAPLAGKDSPILLTDKNTLTQATRDELTKLGVKKVYVVGAISEEVFNEVKAISGDLEVIQLKGTDRIATAALISSKLTSPAGYFVVGYDALPDALSVASYAATHNYSILVTNPDGSLPASSKRVGKGYTVGGVKKVNPIYGIDSLAGEDRYATNNKVLGTLNYSYNRAYVANGTDGHLVDSLIASSLAAKDQASIVLTSNGNNGDAASASVGAKLLRYAVVIALGGEDVVSNTTVSKVISAAPENNPDETAYINKLKMDYDFNISEGARILNQKWRTVPKIGDGDRNKLENWYFAVWAYNGWLPRNNPNYAKSLGVEAYQDKVFRFMNHRYNFPTTPWNQTLPPTLPPSYLSTWSTPTPYHLGDLTINPTLLLSEGGSPKENANGDYWYNYSSSTAIYSLGYYVTGYNATTTTETDRATFKAKLILAAKKVITYGETQLNSAKTVDDVYAQTARKYFWAVLQLPNLDSATWQKAQEKYDQAQALPTS